MSILIWGGHSPIMLTIAEFLLETNNIVYVSRNIDDEILRLGSTNSRKYDFVPVIFDPLLSDSEDLFTEAFYKKNDIRGILIGHRYRGEENISKELQVNVLSPFKAIEAYCFMSPWETSMRRNVIVMSSPASKRVIRDQGVGYHASKASLDAIVRYLSVEKLDPNLSLISLSLNSFIEKERSRKFFKSNPHILNEIESKLPQQRMTRIYEIAEVVKMLLTVKTTLLNGVHVELDGGLSLLDTSNFIGKQS